MAMAKIEVCGSSELPPGSMTHKEVEGRNILVANVGGKYYAINGDCNHAGGPLWEGELNGAVITCPWHGSTWDVTTGMMKEFAVDLDPEPTFKAYEENGKIFIEV